MKMALVANCQNAFILVIKEATVADTRAAVMAIKFVAVANLVPALGALNGSIDQLKHRKFRSSVPPFENPIPLSTVLPNCTIPFFQRGSSKRSFVVRGWY
jgi:hypothetical protein